LSQRKQIDCDCLELKNKRQEALSTLFGSLPKRLADPDKKIREEAVVALSDSRDVPEEVLRICKSYLRSVRESGNEELRAEADFALDRIDPFPALLNRLRAELRRAL